MLVPTHTYYAFPLNVRHEIVVNGRTVAMASSPTEGGTLFTEDGAQPLGDVMRIGVERATMRNPVVLMKARLGRAFEAEHFGVETIDAREADRVRVSQQDNETALIIEARTVVSRDPLPDQGEERRGASDRGPLQRVEGAFVRSRLSARGARRGGRPPGVRSHDAQRGGRPAVVGGVVLGRIRNAGRRGARWTLMADANIRVCEAAMNR